MVASARIKPQSATWSQQQEQKWDTLAKNKMDQLDSLFEDHLRWFRQHKTATSLIATRRTLTNDDTTEDGQTKRPRFNDTPQDQFDPHQNDTTVESNSKQNRQPINISATTTFDDNALDTPSQDSHPPTSNVIGKETIPDNIERGSPQPPAKISREYLLRHFEQEEQKYGRYGLRNRSLGSSHATISSSKQTTNSMETTPEQQPRRKTISCIEDNNDNTNDDLCSIPTVDEDTKKEAATATATETTDNIPPPAPTASSPPDTTTTPATLSPSQQSNTPTPKDQKRRTYGQEEQLDDEVLLLSRPGNSNKKNDASLRLDQHSGLNGSGNNSLIANEGYSFSSIFSFGRAALEPSIHYDDLNISSSSKAYTPKRHNDSHHTRTSRLTHPSPSTPSKSKTPASPMTRTGGHTKSSSATSGPSKHRSYTPGRPWDATPVSTSFLSSSTIYSTTSLKRDSSRQIDDPQPSNYKRSSQENGEKKHDQKVTTDSNDNTDEPQKEGDVTTEESPQPTVLIPSWATYPELDQLLRKQISMDADKIFGKMPPLQVSQIVNTGGH